MGRVEEWRDEVKEQRNDIIVTPRELNFFVLLLNLLVLTLE